MKKKRGKKETIFVFGAHSDDFVIGAGGTIAKYAKEGKKIISIVFSYGEKSHPWLKEEVVQKMRAKEALQSSKILGCKTYIFNLKEGHFLEEYPGIEAQVKRLVSRYKPTRIFTHSDDDPHPDHRSTYQLTLKFQESLSEPKPELYVYSVWNPVSLKTTCPTLYEDITSTFSLKLNALTI